MNDDRTFWLTIRRGLILIKNNVDQRAVVAGLSIIISAIETRYGAGPLHTTRSGRRYRRIVRSVFLKRLGNPFE
jgi:phenylalanine-4-hydroxylase